MAFMVREWDAVLYSFRQRSMSVSRPCSSLSDSLPRFTLVQGMPLQRLKYFSGGQCGTGGSGGHAWVQCIMFAGLGRGCWGWLDELSDMSRLEGLRRRAYVGKRFSRMVLCSEGTPRLRTPRSSV